MGLSAECEVARRNSRRLEAAETKRSLFVPDSIVNLWQILEKCLTWIPCVRGVWSGRKATGKPVKINWERLNCTGLCSAKNREIIGWGLRDCFFGEIPTARQRLALNCALKYRTGSVVCLSAVKLPSALLQFPFVFPVPFLYIAQKEGLHAGTSIQRHLQSFNQGIVQMLQTAWNGVDAVVPEWWWCQMWRFPADFGHFAYDIYWFPRNLEELAYFYLDLGSCIYFNWTSAINFT